MRPLRTLFFVGLLGSLTQAVPLDFNVHINGDAFLPKSVPSDLGSPKLLDVASGNSKTHLNEVDPGHQIILDESPQPKAGYVSEPVQISIKRADQFVLFNVKAAKGKYYANTTFVNVGLGHDEVINGYFVFDGNWDYYLDHTRAFTVVVTDNHIRLSIVGGSSAWISGNYENPNTPQAGSDIKWKELPQEEL